MIATAEPRPSRLLAALRIAGLAGLFLTYLPPHLLSKLLFRHSHWPRRFLAAAARIAGARIRVRGAPLEPHTLVVANHTSWLDILVLGGAAGTAFVSKAEVRGTPLIGWLADQNHTLYIERAERSDAHGQVRRISEALDAIAWHSGERGLDNALRVLGRRGTIDAVAHLLDPLPPSSDRKVHARHARARIAAALPSLHAPTGL